MATALTALGLALAIAAGVVVLRWVDARIEKAMDVEGDLEA
jgi:capsular polysaccharide biosynthesis protein